MEIKRKDGTYVLPDDPAFGRSSTTSPPITRPSSPTSPSRLVLAAARSEEPRLQLLQLDPQEYAYKHPEWPSKEAILAARDHLLQLHPNLKVVGAHLGSMEVDVDQIAQRFDKYPNFAVDTAARVNYLMLQKPEKVRAFLIKYQDRVVYGTDNVLYPPTRPRAVLKEWADRYERDWKILLGRGRRGFEEGTTKGLHLPKDVLRKLYHDNAVKWIPGDRG